MRNIFSGRPQQRTWIGRGVLILGLSVFVWLKGIGAIGNVRDSWTIDDWESTSGVVTKSETYTSRSRRGSRRRHYVFEYEFNVDGGRFVSSRYSLADASGDRRTGQEAYKVGNAVEVFYNASHPDRSVIDRSAGMFWNYLTIFSMTVIAVILAAMGWAKYQKLTRARRKS